MAIDNFRVQFTRGTTAQNDNYLGRDGEITIDKESGSLILHDGVKTGGKAISKPVNGSLRTDTGLSRYIHIATLDPLNLFASGVVDGDLVYFNYTTSKFEKALAMDKGTVIRFPDGTFNFSDTNAENIADVTNGTIHSFIRTVTLIPDHLQDIILADIPAGNHTLYTHPTIPGKVTTIDPLISHGIKCSVLGSTDGNRIINTGERTGKVTYTASEGEDISLPLNRLLMLHEEVRLTIPLNVNCVIERDSVLLHNTKLIVVCGGRLDVTVTVPAPQYDTGGVWYTCSGFFLCGGDIKFYGNGEIHHHIPPGTRLYPTANQLIGIGPNGYINNVQFTSHNLDIYNTIGVVGHGKGGSHLNISMTGINLHLERLSPAIAALVGEHPTVVNQGSWAFDAWSMDIISTGITVVGGYLSFHYRDGIYRNATGGVGDGYSGMVIT